MIQLFKTQLFITQVILLCCMISSVYSSDSMICDHSTANYAFQTDTARCTFKPSPPTFSVTYPNAQTTSGQAFYVNVMFLRVWEVIGDPNDPFYAQLFDIPTVWDVQCTNDTGVINQTGHQMIFTSELSNNVTGIQLITTLFDNPADYVMAEGSPLTLLPQSIHIRAVLTNWVSSSPEGRIRVTMSISTSAGVFDISMPSYYADGNIRSARIAGAQSDIVVFCPDEGFTCQNDTSGCEPVGIKTLQTDLTTSPLSATFGVMLTSFINQSDLVYFDSAMEFVPPAVGKDTRIIIIVASILVGLLLIGAIVTIIVLHRKYKKEDREKWNNMRADVLAANTNKETSLD